MFKLLDMLASGAAFLTGKSVDRYFALETAEISFHRRTGEPYLNHMFVASDGSYASVLKFDGSYAALGESERNSLREQIDSALDQYFANPGYAIQFYFCRDPEIVGRKIAKMVSRSRRTAADRDLDLSDFYDAREQKWRDISTGEESYIVLWTRKGALNSEEKKKNKDVPDFVLKPNSSGQRIELAVEALYDRHRSFCEDVKDVLIKNQLKAKFLNVKAALKVIRSTVYPSSDRESWSARLPLDPMILKEPDSLLENDLSSVMWPKLSSQVITHDPVLYDETFVRLGQDMLVGYDMALAPDGKVYFQELVDRCFSQDPLMPWRISFLLEGGGDRRMGLKKILATFLQLSNRDHHRKIIRSINYLSALKSETNSSIVAMRVNLATWAPADNIGLLHQRSRALVSAFNGWGKAQLQERAADVVGGVLSSALALGVKSTADTAGAPLMETIPLLPVDRPACPYEDGITAFHTEDKVLFPYQTGSAKQEQGLEIYFAKPRKGKSVLLNTINMSFILSSTGEANRKLLAPCVILDIGDSAKGLVDILHELLPYDRRHEVIYQVPENGNINRINPLDISLGLKSPLPLEKSAALRILSIGLGAKTKDFNAMLGMVIDLTYEKLADPRFQRLYREGVDPLVDQAVEDLALEITETTTWYNLRDTFFDKGVIRAATNCQRMAVPRLSDLSQAVNSDEIRHLYGDINLENGEKMTKYCVRKLGELIELYPILNGFTTYDLSEARVKVFNLAKVCPKGDEEQTKQQRSLMYLLFRHLLVGDFYTCAALDDNLIDNFEPQYRKYQHERLSQLRGVQKRVTYEEFHRTEGSEDVLAQVDSDTREGPKCGVQIALVSQDMRDFPPKLIRMANAAFILQGGDDKYCKDVVDSFGLNEASMHILKFKLNRPGQFLMYLSVDGGKVMRFMENRLSSYELWVYTTTAEDCTLRSALIQKIGIVKALRLLSVYFPEGSAKAEVERLKNATVRDFDGSVYDEIINNMFTFYKESVHKNTAA